jgi:hypothetical protein
MDAKTQAQLSILVDRSQGGGSVSSGSLEVMLHRRLLQDDHHGVGEALNETGLSGKGLVIRCKHWMTLDFPDSSANLRRLLAERLSNPLVGALRRVLIDSVSLLLSFSISFSSHPSLFPLFLLVFPEQLPSFTPANSFSSYVASHRTSWSWLPVALPDNIHLQTVQLFSTSPKQYLIRLGLSFLSVVLLVFLSRSLFGVFCLFSDIRAPV